MNLISLVNAKNTMTPELYQKYKEINNVSIKDYETECVEQMINLFSGLVGVSSDLVKYFNSFSIGYKIKQIGKEFDLLRIGGNYNLNIELKSQFTSNDKIKRQLVKNDYYLKPLKKKTYLITFIKEDHRFIELKDDGLTDISTGDVLKLICDQTINTDDNLTRTLDQYFDPSYYLVSPFNSTTEFIKDEYFLTAQQDEIKKELLDKHLNKPNKISIKGAAGTGKTLLIYDVAKEQMLKGKKVLIIHCGILNEGHYKLKKEYNWNIYSAKHFRSQLENEWDLIIVDECQRINRHQFDRILLYFDKMKIPCIFSHDGEQCLHNSEIDRQMAKEIIKESNIKRGLKEKVRSNKEMATFIKYLFNMNTIDWDKQYNFKESVFVTYFENMELAKEYVSLLEHDGWQFINFTNSIHNRDPFDHSIIEHEDLNAHRVVGQEFEKVSVIIDNNFFYRDGRIIGTTRSYYHSSKMLFQILTRTKKKLHLILVNNEDFMRSVSIILEGKKSLDD